METNISRKNEAKIPDQGEKHITKDINNVLLDDKGCCNADTHPYKKEPKCTNISKGIKRKGINCKIKANSKKSIKVENVKKPQSSTNDEEKVSKTTTPACMPPMDKNPEKDNEGSLGNSSLFPPSPPDHRPPHSKLIDNFQPPIPFNAARPSTRHHLIDLHSLAIFLYKTTRCINCYAANCLSMMGSISQNFPPSVTRICLKCQNCCYSLYQDLVKPKNEDFKDGKGVAAPSASAGVVHQTSKDLLEPCTASLPSSNLSHIANQTTEKLSKSDFIEPTSKSNNKENFHFLDYGKVSNYKVKLPDIVDLSPASSKEAKDQHKFEIMSPPPTPKSFQIMSPSQSMDLSKKNSVVPPSTVLEKVKENDEPNKLPLTKDGPCEPLTPYGSNSTNEKLHIQNYLQEKSSIGTIEIQKWITHSNEMLEIISEKNKSNNKTLQEEILKASNSSSMTSETKHLKSQEARLVLSEERVKQDPSFSSFKLRDMTIISKLLELTETLKHELVARSKEIKDDVEIEHQNFNAGEVRFRENVDFNERGQNNELPIQSTLNDIKISEKETKKLVHEDNSTFGLEDALDTRVTNKSQTQIRSESSNLDNEKTVMNKWCNKTKTLKEKLKKDTYKCKSIYDSPELNRKIESAEGPKIPDCKEERNLISTKLENPELENQSMGKRVEEPIGDAPSLSLRFHDLISSDSNSSNELIIGDP